MTKTKFQLRAEAVERLRECKFNDYGYIDGKYATWQPADVAIGYETHTYEQQAQVLIDLLTDDDYAGLKQGEVHEGHVVSEYYCGRCGYPVTDHDSYCSECGVALYGESMDASDDNGTCPDAPGTAAIENAKNANSCDSHADFCKEVTKNGTKCNESCVKLPDGDAVELLRKAASGEFDGNTGQVEVNLCNLTNALSGADSFYSIADMVERDYVQRDYHRAWVRYAERVTEECDHTKEQLANAEHSASTAWDRTRKAERERDSLLDLLRDAARDYKWCRDLLDSNIACAVQAQNVAFELCEERDKWKAKAEQVPDGYVELPKGADGEYIHIGDELYGWAICGHPTDVVHHLKLSKDGWAIGTSHNVESTPSLYRHHEPTLEDVLCDLASDISTERDGNPRTFSVKDVADYAERIREFLGVDS